MDGLPRRWPWPCYLGLRGRVAALRTWLGPAVLALRRSADRAVRVGRPRQLPRLRPHPRHSAATRGSTRRSPGPAALDPVDQPGRGAVDHRAERLRPVRHAAARAVVVGRRHLAAPGRVGVAARRGALVARRAGPAAGRARPRPARPGRRAVDPQPARRRHRGARRAHRRRRHRARLAAVVVAARRCPGGRARRSAGCSWPSPGRRSSPMPSWPSASSPPGGWWVTGRRRWRGCVAALVGGVVVVAGALHLWAGRTSTTSCCARAQAVSLATPWRPLLEWGRDAWGNGPHPGRDQHRGGAAGRAAGLVPAARQPPWRDRSVDGARMPGAPHAPFARRGAVGHRVPGAAPTRSPRPTRCPGTTCSSGAPCRRCCPGCVDLVAAGPAGGPGGRLRAGSGARHDAGRRGPHAGCAPRRRARGWGWCCGWWSSPPACGAGLRDGSGLVEQVRHRHRHDERHGEGRADGRDRHARVVDQEADASA